MYLAGFIYNLTIPNPVRDKVFDRIVNGDMVRYFATLARVETGAIGGSVHGLFKFLTFKLTISNSSSINPQTGQRMHQLQQSRQKNGRISQKVTVCNV